MGVSLSRAAWSPLLHARRSVLISSAGGSPGCGAVLSIAYVLNYTARGTRGPSACPTVADDPLLAHSAPIGVEGNVMKTILISIAGSTLLAALAAAQMQPRYTVIDLDASDPFSSGSGINNAGSVGGSANLPGYTVQRAILWRRGQSKNLAHWEGPTAIATEAHRTAGTRWRCFPRLRCRIHWARTSAISAPTRCAAGRSGRMGR